MALSFSHLSGSLYITGSVSASLGISGSIDYDLDRIDHDQLFNYSASRHVDHAAVSINTGTGLSGGGTLETTRTITFTGAGTQVVSSSNQFNDYDSPFTGSFTGSFSGDGSGITGISGFAVTNEGNNRVITSTTAGNGNAEANLSFDGSILTVGGIIQADGDASTHVLETTADVTLQLKSTDTYTGIQFNDQGSNNDTIWHNGANGTFSIGGGGSNVSGKKLHIDGGTTIGANYDAVSPPSNGLRVEGEISGSSLDISGTFSLANIADVSASLASAIAGGDGLGNHTATQDLDLGGFDITNATDISGSTLDIATSAVMPGDVSFGTLTADNSETTSLMVNSSNQLRYRELGGGAFLNTAAIADGGTGLATADQIHTFVTGLGYTSNTGTVTSVAITGGTGIDVTSGSPITTSGTIALGIDLSELTDMTDAMVGADEFIVLDTSNSSGDRRKAASEINLSIFNNDSGFTANTGTVDTSGTPVDNDFAKFTDANTVEGRSYSEVKQDLSLDNVTNESKATMFSSPNFTGSVTGSVGKFTTSLDIEGSGSAEYFTIEPASDQETAVLNFDTNIGNSPYPTAKIRFLDQGVEDARIEFGTDPGDDGLFFYMGSNKTLDLGGGATNDVKLNYNGNTKLQTIATGINVTGEVRASSDITAYYSSDRRLKENIVNISQPLEKLSYINGVEFDWIKKEGVHSYEGHDVGVIAQEIEQVLPELVTTRDNGYKAVRYEKIVALLIEAVKDQQSQIEELKSRL